MVYAAETSIKRDARASTPSIAVFQGLAFVQAAVTDATPLSLPPEAAAMRLRCVGMDHPSSLKIAVLDCRFEAFEHDADLSFLTVVKHCGGGRIWRNNERSSLDAGSVGLHQFGASSYRFEEWTRVMQAHVPFVLVDMVCQSLFGTELRHDHLRARMGVTDNWLCSRMEIIHSAIYWSEPTALLLDSWALMLSEAVVRRFSIHDERSRRRSLGKIPARGMAYVVDYVEANLDQDIRLAALADLATMSRYHFAHRFRETIGLSPHAYVMERRVARAQDLLKRGESGLAQVALACGFADQAHFTTTFRRKIGMTPGEYQRAVAA
jgi:AraC family transcriptional regulator